MVLRRLCVNTESYSPRHIMTALECIRRCDAQPGCVVAKYSSAASLCWLSKSRKMAPLGGGCDGKFKNIYDYYVERTYTFYYCAIFRIEYASRCFEAEKEISRPEFSNHSSPIFT